MNAPTPPAALEPTPGAAPVLPPTPAGEVAEWLEDPSGRRWFRRPVTWVVAAAVLVALGGAGWWWTQRAASRVPTFHTQPVTRGDLTLTVTANGTVQPTRSISIGSELSGTVLNVNVDVNDVIHKGQVLAVLDTAKLRDQILRSQATADAAASRAALAAATVAEARAALGRLEEVAQLSGGKVPSRSELDAGRASLARAVADEAATRATIRDAQAAQSTDRINLSKASIRAPADGVVLSRSVDPGNAVAASFQAVTLFTVAEDLARLRLWVYVDEADVGSVRVGQQATFTVSAYPARGFPARITRVGFGSTITDNVVTYLTYLDVDNTDLSLRPGMTATATIVAVQRKDVLQVPNTALRFTPTAATAAVKKGLGSGLVMGPPRAERKSAASAASTAGARQVWVLRDGEPVAVAVMPGISDGRMTEITSGDLQVGMEVITDQRAAAR